MFSSTARSSRRRPALLLVVPVLALVLVDRTGAGAAVLDLVRSEPPLPGIGRADGYLEGRSVSATDDAEPAVSRLDPALRTALVQATHVAAREGVALRVNSGWRSPAYQRALLERAEQKYGDDAEARRWVRTPQTSTHVTGEAVDVGPVAGADWLGEHGARFGLCRTYRNEPWHFELRTTRAGRCPAPSADGASWTDRSSGQDLHR